MARVAQTAPRSAGPSGSRLRAVLGGIVGVGAVLTLILFAYELALARVPQHRAALEHLVQAQTGLDVRFGELGLRWGWYGPEAVFRSVELDEPGSAQAVLRAPELVVGFDTWRTLRSGHPEAGRITLIAPEIDFSGGNHHRGVGIPGALPGGVRPAAGTGGLGAEPWALGRISVLQRWRGGRIDIEGGMVRLPDPGTAANPFSLQIRRATLRRAGNDWSVTGFLFLPDRVGRSARVTLHVNGDLADPASLSGALRIEAQRLLFPGCREFLAGIADLAPYLPRGGSGSVTADLSFERGRIAAASGTVRAGGLVFDSAARANLLALDRVHGDWRLMRLGSGWRIRVSSLDLVKGARPASLSLDVGDSVGPESRGRWLRGTLQQAPLEPVFAVARWLEPHLDLAGIQLAGTARSVTFDWASGRPEGARLQTFGELEDVALVPRSKDFTLGGLAVRVSGNESQLTLDVQSRTARLELAQSQQDPLADIHVSSLLLVSASPDGWRIATDGFLLEHQRASLSLSGALHGGSDRDGVLATEPRIFATGTLSGADVPLVMRLLGNNTAQAFGAAASRLTAGRIQNAQFALQGPIGKLPFDNRDDGFTGSLTLRDAILSGGDLWPDAEGIDGHVEWHGARIQATIDAGHAGPFQLASAKAQWDADGRSPTRLTGHINGRLEDAVAWVRDHPRLQEFAPDAGEMDASGDAAFDFNVSVPANMEAQLPQPRLQARVSTFIDAARVQAVSGLPPLEGVTGSFVFDSGRLQRSVLTGSWLGGPVTLRVGEHREKGARVLAIQAQGTLNAQQLASLANASGTVEGNTEWAGELAYLQADGSPVPGWRLRADSNLLGVVSSLPEPLAKRSGAVLPVHLEVTGSGDSAHMRANLGDRLRSVFALQRRPDVGWTIDRGAVRFGIATPLLPSEPVVLVRGRLSELDLPAYAMAWQRLRWDALPALRAQIGAGELLVGGRRYGDVSVRAERTDSGTDLLLDSASVAGMARWPAPPGVTRRRGASDEAQSAELHLSRLDLPDGTLSSEGIGLFTALAPTALLSVDELNWRGRSLGRLTASVATRDNVVVMDDVRLLNGTHEAHGVLRCQTAMPTCRLSFKVDSNDAAATLADFGFTPDLAASAASLKGDLEWLPASGQPWLVGLRGRVSMRLADGALHGRQRGEAKEAGDAKGASETKGAGEAQGAGEALNDPGVPFALLAVPALVSGLDAPGAAGVSLTKERRELHFDHLEADFELHDGQAMTSNLHFDGDAEILMRGRTGLVSRDYDQQVWILRGEERLPAAVRRFGATPRVAAAWLSLRDLFGSNGAQDRSHAVLRLQGSWDDPMVVAEN